MDVPPFYSAGDPEGDFYALASVTGGYIVHDDEPAFYILWWSPSEGFTRFSFTTARRSDGSQLSYHRGTDDLDTLEFAILRASQQELVPPYAWRLFPSAAIDEDAFRSEEVRAGYHAARQRLCLILYTMRVSAWSNVQYPGGESRFFRMKDVSPPDPGEESAENAEINRVLDEIYGDADDDEDEDDA